MPHELDPRPAEFFLPLLPNSRSTLHYVLQPSRRGAFAIDAGSRPREEPAGVLAVSDRLPGRDGDPRLSRHAAAFAIRAVGPDQPPEPAGRAPGAKDRPGPRFRAAPRLQHRRQLQAHRLAGDRAAAKTHRQGLSGQPEPANHLPDRLRADDDQPGGGPEPAGSLDQRRAHARLRGPAAGRQRRHDYLLRRDSRLRAALRRHEPDEPPAARLLRPLPAADRIALRRGIPLPRPRTAANGRWSCWSPTSSTRSTPIRSTAT